MPMKIEWIEIPGGEFLMGLSDTQVKELAKEPYGMRAPYDGIIADERPQRIIDVPTYYIARFAITRQQYDQFVHATHPEWDVPVFHEPDWADHPISLIWHHARAFCAWIGARLPTTYEWEKAACGTDGRLYPWGNEWDLTRGNFGQRDPRGKASGRRDSAVGSYPNGASPHGVEDMVGNGFEWTMTLGLVPPEAIQARRYSQRIFIRGTDPDPDTIQPWVHRVTHIITGGLFSIGTPPYTGFRPVMDEWQRQTWSGFQGGGNIDSGS